MSVLITVDDSIGTVTLNRPEAFNTITIELAQAVELETVLEHLSGPATFAMEAG